MTFRTPTISYLVTSYYKPDRLRLCLEALDRQIYPPHQVVVSDDGTGNKQNERIARKYGAEWVTREHTWKEYPTQDGGVERVSIKNIPGVLNQGAALCTGDIIQTLQQDHILAPDFGLWLARCWEPTMVMLGWTHHRWGKFTVKDLDAMLRNCHLPDGEVRYRNYFSAGKGLERECLDWRKGDGLDAAVSRWVWQDLDTNFIGQDHSWMDWLLRMQLQGLRIMVNPLMRLWHMSEPEPWNREQWQGQLEESRRYMESKWGGNSIWANMVENTFNDMRGNLLERQKAHGVEPEEEVRK